MPVYQFDLNIFLYRQLPYCLLQKYKKQVARLLPQWKVIVGEGVTGVIDRRVLGASTAKEDQKMRRKRFDSDL